nr:hypothetical protein [Tanacetum cinerariifolium]
MIIEQEIEEGGDAEEHVQDVTDDAAAQGDDTAAYGEVPTLSRTIHIISYSTYSTTTTTSSRSPINIQGTTYSTTITSALDACTALTRRVEHLEYDKVAQALEITKLKRRVKKLEKGNRVRVLKLRRLKKVGTSQRIDTSDDTVMEDASNQGRIIDENKDDGRQAESQDEIYIIDIDHASKVLSIQEDEETEVHKVVDVVTTATLIIEVVTATSETVTAASTTISTVEPQVPTATITAAPAKVDAVLSRRRKGVVIRDLEEESSTSSIIPTETKSKDKGKGILVKEPKPLKKKQQVEMDEEYARKLHAELNKILTGILDYFKGMSYDDICLIFEAKFNSNIEFPLKTKEQMEEEERRALQSINETPAQKAAKR